MNNFFYDSSDYGLFKKAFKTTRNEPVVINILSSDSSLKASEDPNKPVKSTRKTMSNRYQPNSPFGRFFGPRKPDTSPIDMKDFSSWKNKNYRKIEENLDKVDDEDKPKFSLADYLKSKNKNKFQSADTTTMSTQKPVTQLSASEPAYKKFFLDRYMNNIEQETKVKTEFEQNDDLLEPLGEDTQKTVADSSQDEDFTYINKFDVEEVVNDDDISGEKYKLEMKELDEIKKRLDMIEKRNKEAEKPKKEEPIFTISEPDEEEEEPVVEEAGEQEPEIAEEAEADEEQDAVKEEPKTAKGGLRVVAVSPQEETETFKEEPETTEEEDEEVQPQPTANTRKSSTIYTYEYPEDVNETRTIYVERKASDEDDKVQSEMQAKLDELIEQNKQADERYEQSMRKANLEKQKVAEEYELRIRELEESYKKHVEEIKQQSYLEKLERDAKLDEIQSKISIRERELSEKERASLTMLNTSALLQQELKSNLDISNLEMDKRLLEMSSEDRNIDLDVNKLSELNLNNEENSSTKRTRKSKSVKTGIDVDVSTGATTKKKRKRKKKKKIDSDIVTDYNFD